MPRPPARVFHSVAVVLVAGLVSACRTPSTFRGGSLGTAHDLAPAGAVGAVDLDGDGDDTLVLIQDDVATWDGQRLELGCRAQVVARGDLGGDGHEELLIGCGMGRGLPRAPARVWMIEREGSRLLWERDGARNQVSDLRVVGQDLWFTTFADGKRVEGGWLRLGDSSASVFESVVEVPLGLEQLPLGDAVIVGRVYGEEPRSDGDLRSWRDGSWTSMPSLRGVRSLASADLDADGDPDLLVGDGWHYRYGSQAVGRVRLLEGPDWQRARTVASFDGEFSAREIQVVGEGAEAWILVTGTEHAHVLLRDGLGWLDLPVAPLSEQGMAVAARQDGQQGVLTSGTPARWTPILR